MWPLEWIALTRRKRPDYLAETSMTRYFVRFGKLALERDAAHLAVGDHFEARLFLEPHDLVHRRVLDPLELSRMDVAHGVAFTGGFQPRRAEQATNGVGPGLGHGPSLASSQTAVMRAGYRALRPTMRR